jgi:hypothetical protein
MATFIGILCWLYVSLVVVAVVGMAVGKVVTTVADLISCIPLVKWWRKKKQLWEAEPSPRTFKEWLRLSVRVTVGLALAMAVPLALTVVTGDPIWNKWIWSSVREIGSHWVALSVLAAWVCYRGLKEA